MMPTKPPTQAYAATSRCRRSMLRAPRSSKSSWPPTPSSPRCTQVLSDLGAGLPESGRQASCRALRSGGRRRPLLGSQGATAVHPRDDVSQGDADAYFDYAAKAGLESDLTALCRLAVVRRGTETLPRRTAGGCREVAAQLCAELSEGVLPDRRALLFERLLPPLGRARGGHRDAHGARRPGRPSTRSPCWRSSPR